MQPAGHVSLQLLMRQSASLQWWPNYSIPTLYIPCSNEVLNVQLTWQSLECGPSAVPLTAAWKWGQSTCRASYCSWEVRAECRASYCCSEVRTEWRASYYCREVLRQTYLDEFELGRSYIYNDRYEHFLTKYTLVVYMHTPRTIYWINILLYIILYKGF